METQVYKVISGDILNQCMYKIRIISRIYQGVVIGNEVNLFVESFQ